MKNMSFADKICWITGASSGIGAALAVKLNSCGARLIISARNRNRLQDVKLKCPNPERVVILECDMEESEKLQSIAMQAWSIFNAIDYVFLNAGIAVRDMVLDTEIEMVKKVMDINFFSNVMITKTLLPLMIENGSGHFVVTSSICGRFGVPKLSAYSASKHALHGFYESLRSEYEKCGIKVTIITSGMVRTNITLNALKGDGTTYGKMQESIANGASPENCAEEILQAAAAQKREVLTGGTDRYCVLLKRFFPGFLAWVICRHPLKKIRKVKHFIAGIFQSEPGARMLSIVKS